MTIEKSNIKLSLIEEADAEFILSLRLNERLQRYISKTGSDLSLQIAWIRDYKIRERKGEEYYFKCQDLDGNDLGTTRIYNFRGDTFELGSWIFAPSAGSNAIIADILTKEYAFENLGFNFCTFDVRKLNKTVLNYHRKYDPEIVFENDLDIGFRLSKPVFLKKKEKFLQLLK